MQARIVLIGCLALVAAILATAPAAAQSRAFPGSDVFTMHLPSGWVRIPDEVLEEFSARARQASPSLPEHVYACGFQGQAGPPWALPPFVLVQVANTGRISEAALLDPRRADAALDKAAAAARNRLKDLVSDVDLSGSSYEPEGHILWKTGVVEGTEGRGGKLLVGVRLTQVGMISIICFAREKDFDAYRPTFERIVRDVELDDRLVYKPRLIDAHPWLAYIGWGEPWGYAMASMAIALVSGISAAILARRKKAAAKGDSLRSAGGPS